MSSLPEVEWDKMAEAAWVVRDAAHVLGPTKVGAVAISVTGEIFVGCNVEHRFRSHDVHAEVNAITNMVASGEKALKAILIASERSRFTPCGACLDWIFEFGGGDCQVGYQAGLGGDVVTLTAHDLMPYYPE